MVQSDRIMSLPPPLYGQLLKGLQHERRSKSWPKGVLLVPEEVGPWYGQFEKVHVYTDGCRDAKQHRKEQKERATEAKKRGEQPRVPGLLILCAWEAS